MSNTTGTPAHNPFEAIQVTLQTLVSICAKNTAELEDLKKQLVFGVPNSQTPKLSLTEFEAAYKISKPTIHLLMRKGEIPFEKIGRRTLFDRKKIEAYFSSKNRQISKV